MNAMLRYPAIVESVSNNLVEELRLRGDRSSGAGSCSVLKKIVALMPYLSMASRQVATYFVESSIVWETIARALLRYFVFPMNFTGPEFAAPAAATVRIEATQAKDVVRIGSQAVIRSSNGARY
jgi:hypothetical protein